MAGGVHTASGWPSQRHRAPRFRVRLLECGNIDLDRATDMYLHVGEVILVEDVAIELLDERGRPEAVKAFPAAALADGRMKVVQQRHDCGPSSRSDLTLSSRGRAASKSCSRQQITHRQLRNFTAIEHQRHNLIEGIVAPLGVSRLIARTARRCVDLHAAFGNVHDPVNRHSRRRIDAPLKSWSRSTDESEISTKRPASAEVGWRHVIAILWAAHDGQVRLRLTIVGCRSGLTAANPVVRQHARQVLLCTEQGRIVRWVARHFRDDPSCEQFNRLRPR